ncbi:MAG TPA: TIGR03557 family F420-dependent LLM class oxidoreductase [Thermomicrobiales bacterium]|jgi:G6PDH family F420-dependent oxidoreductase|nr:TIGR03557 family F420-dependent LLM class oxidoreductase [Thermomicrobiales bacterium]
MINLGYTLSSEQYRPNDLIRNGALAEQAGFEFLSISDHFHPWLDSQGHSGFVWSTLGGLAHATSTIRVGTGVTCPTIRIHPAIIAQAVASTADMFEGRFYFAVGSGEYLNEHITGQHWPPASRRQDMLREAVALIRKLWEGKYTTEYGHFYTVENARIYTLPEKLPEIIVAAAGPEAARMAAEIGDGVDSTSPNKEVVETFEQNGGKGSRYGQMTVCYGPDEQAAAEHALKVWGNSAVPGQLSQELALPLYYEQAAQLATVDQMKESVVCGPDPAKYHEKIKAYVDAGFTHLYIHDVGPDQAGFIDFSRRELLPSYGNASSR